MKFSEIHLRGMECALSLEPILAQTEHCFDAQVITAVVTSEIKLFQNYFSVRRCPAEMILFQRGEACLK